MEPRYISKLAGYLVRSGINFKTRECRRIINEGTFCGMNKICEIDFDNSEYTSDLMRNLMNRDLWEEAYVLLVFCISNSNRRDFAADLVSETASLLHFVVQELSLTVLERQKPKFIFDNSIDFAKFAIFTELYCTLDSNSFFDVLSDKLITYEILLYSKDIYYDRFKRYKLHKRFSKIESYFQHGECSSKVSGWIYDYYKKLLEYIHLFRCTTCKSCIEQKWRYFHVNLSYTQKIRFKK